MNFCRGAPAIRIFEGIMDRFLYTDILDRMLLPFLSDAYLNGHRFMMDNDPKHTSCHAKTFLTDHEANWWVTPPESPDANPIENLWNEKKDFMRREVKPKTKNELVEGIKMLWQTVDINKCDKYIRHLRKVLPRIIELNGAATGY